MELSEETKKENLRKIKLYKYIGETARSSYERNLEHLRDYKEMKQYIRVEKSRRMST